MLRVYFLGICLLIMGYPLVAERVLSRERSFIAPSLVVRKEIKKEDTSAVKVPTASPKLISLDASGNVASNIIITRPIDFVFIHSSDMKFSQNSYYSINGGPFFRAMGAIQMPRPGSYQITYYTVDVFGNRDSGRTRLLVVDAEPPKLELRFSPALSILEERPICSQNVSLLLSANDQLSGVRSIFWKTSSEEVWKRYEKAIPVNLAKDEDFLTIHSYAVDHAGNVSQVDTISCYSPDSIGKISP